MENCVERAAILAEGASIEPSHLGLAAGAGHRGDLEAFARAVGVDGGLDEVGARARDLAERLVIERALAEAAGNKSRAAEALRVNYKRLLSRIRELGLNDRKDA
jgi:DNA-binding NtrC family response regulator